MAAKGKAWTKQTQEVLEAICEALRLGVPSSRAAKSAGISYSTFCAWRSDGWAQIEDAPEDSTEALPFEARFAVEVEASLVEFMKPFLARIRDETKGQGKGDWRACRAILEMRFPDEFSEKVHAAKSGKMEISGTITHEMASIYADFMRWKNMSRVELKSEIERMSAQVGQQAIEGKHLDDEITFLGGKLAAMRAAQADGRVFFPGNWLVLNPAVKATVPKIIDLDESEISTDLAADIPELAPVEAGAENILPSASATPSAPLSSGIAYDAATGLAYHPELADEDTTL